MKNLLPSETSSLASRTALKRPVGKLVALFLFVWTGMINEAGAAGVTDRLYVAAEIGLAGRELNGPLLREQPTIFPGAPTSFRKGSSRTEVYGAAHLGVKITRFFALEAGYQDFGAVDVRFSIPPDVVYLVPPPEFFRFRDRAFTLDPVFSWEINPRVTLHGFVGVAFNWSDVTVVDYPRFSIFQSTKTKSSESAQVRMGVGADFQLTSKLRWRVGGNYQRFSSFTKEGWLAHTGLAYTF